MKKKTKESYIEKEEMQGNNYILKMREYLDYLEEHLNNVRKAFNELSKKCVGLWWVNDDYFWHTLRQQVKLHDLSKFSKEEFVEYQQAFFPVGEKGSLGNSWEHHKENNHHHWESAETDLDIVHMVIDWTAMGYKFGDTAQEYYEANKKRIILNKRQKNIVFEIFNKLKEDSI